MKTLFFAWAISLFSGPAYACSSTPVPSKEDVLDHAEFIGIVRVGEVETITYDPPLDEVAVIMSAAAKYKVNVLQTFHGVLKETPYVFAGDTGCDFPMTQKGGVYRIILYKNSKGQLYPVSRNGDPFSDHEWMEMATNVPANEDLVKMERECSATGGKWQFKEYKGICSVEQR